MDFLSASVPASRIARVVLCLSVVVSAPIFPDHPQTDEFAAVLDPLVIEKLIPGYYFAVYKNGEKVYERSKGSSDDDTGLKPADTTLFAFMSMSKPLISLAVMKLVDSGSIKLDDPLSKFIPGFAAVTVAPGGLYSNQLQPLEREITVKDLLVHTSGLTYSSGIVGVGDVSDAYRDLGVMTLESVPASQWGDLEGQVSKLVGLPLVAQPGERFIYSVSLDVLGRVIEVVSGTSLSSYMADHVFTPLGMEDTGFKVPKTKVARLARLYSPLNRTYQVPGIPKRYQRSVIVPKGQKNYGLDVDEGYESGGAGVISTAKDFERFMNLLMNRGVIGGVPFVSAVNADRMITNQLPDSFGNDGLVGSLGPGAANQGFSFGMGVVLEPNGEVGDPNSYDYLGWAGAANTSFWIDVNKRISGIFLTQHIPVQYNVAPKLEDIAERIYGD